MRKSILFATFSTTFSSIIILSFSAPNQASIYQASMSHRGCDRTNRKECVRETRNNLIASNPSRGYYFVANGCAKSKSWYSCGFVDKTIRVGDWTNMKPQTKPSKEFPQEMTYEVAEMD